MTGSNKGISNVPINLKIYSPNVLSLTLIDLPGVTKVAVGDQPVDIEEQIRNMVMGFIEKETCLILAVSPANVDIANSDALQLAKLVDPKGNRTIGVLTKLDLMDEGTNAMDILQNQVLPLKHGFVGVVNRSQKDIDGNKDVGSAIQKEQQWFANHPQYSEIKEKCGTQYLQQKLKKTLIDHIAKYLPLLQQRLNGRLDSLEKELEVLNLPFKTMDPLFSGGNSNTSPSDPRQMKNVLLNIVRSFSGAVKQIIDGHDGDIGTDSFDALSFIMGSGTTKQLGMAEQRRSIGIAPQQIELNSSVRIKYLFQEVYPETLQSIESILLSTCMDEDIRAIIHNSRGLRAGLFVPDALFEVLIKRHILQLEMPAVECVHEVYDELVKMMRSLLEGPTSPVRAFPRLLEWMMLETTQLLDKAKKPTMDQVKALIQMEIGYINTAHPDFLGQQGVGSWMAQEKRKMRLGVRANPQQKLNAASSKKEGYLIKLGGKRQNWTKRWFSVHDGMVYFYESQKDKTAKGYFPLVGCMVRDMDTGSILPLQPQHEAAISEASEDVAFKGKHNLIEIFTADKSVMFRNHSTLFLEPASLQDKKDWINVFAYNIDLARLQQQSGVAPLTPSRVSPPPKPSKPTSLSIDTPSPPSRSRTSETNILRALPDQLYTKDLQSSNSRAFKQSSMTPELASENESDMADDTFSSTDDTTITLIRMLMHSYFIIVRKHMQDLVPKAIIHLMITRVKKELPQVLSNKIVSFGDGKEISALLCESPEIAADRAKKSNMVRLVRDALIVIDKEVRVELEKS